MGKLRVHILGMPEGPKMTSVAEGCEVARKLFANCEQEWWAEADTIDNYRYPRGSGDYGAEDVDARPHIYEWRNLLPHGSAIPHVPV